MSGPRMVHERRWGPSEAVPADFVGWTGDCRLRTQPDGAHP